MLFGKTVAVYCENHMEHTGTLCEQPYLAENITFPLQSQTGKCCFGKQSLFIVETIGNTQIHYMGNQYLAENTLHLCYRAQAINAAWKNSRCLL
jgi:hypothetical protein